MQLMQSGPSGIVVEAFTGLFSVFESAKAIVLCKFPLAYGPLLANIKGKEEFLKTGTVHVLTNFCK